MYACEEDLCCVLFDTGCNAAQALYSTDSWRAGGLCGIRVSIICTSINASARYIASEPPDESR